MQRASRNAAAVVGELEAAGYKEDDPDAWKVIANLSDDNYDSLDLFQRTCVILRLKSWTLDLPMPQTVDDVDDLPMHIYTPLTIAAVKINFDEGFEKDSGMANPLAVTAG
jgi:hypothetical protein